MDQGRKEGCVYKMMSCVKEMNEELKLLCHNANLCRSDPVPPPDLQTQNCVRPLNIEHLTVPGALRKWLMLWAKELGNNELYELIAHGDRNAFKPAANNLKKAQAMQTREIPGVKQPEDSDEDMLIDLLDLELEPYSHIPHSVCYLQFRCIKLLDGRCTCVITGVSLPII